MVWAGKAAGEARRARKNKVPGKREMMRERRRRCKRIGKKSRR